MCSWRMKRQCEIRGLRSIAVFSVSYGRGFLREVGSCGGGFLSAVGSYRGGWLSGVGGCRGGERVGLLSGRMVFRLACGFIALCSCIYRCCMYRN